MLLKHGKRRNYQEKIIIQERHIRKETIKKNYYSREVYQEGYMALQRIQSEV